jgi:hypothetical protein
MAGVAVNSTTQSLQGKHNELNPVHVQRGEAKVDARGNTHVCINTCVQAHAPMELQLHLKYTCTASGPVKQPCGVWAHSTVLAN